MAEQVHPSMRQAITVNTMNSAAADDGGDAGLTGSQERDRHPPMLGRKSVLVGILTSGFVISNAAQASDAIAGGTSKPIAANQPTYAPKWIPITAYIVGQQVVSPNNDVVSAKVAHNSSATYDSDTLKWALSSTFVPAQASAPNPARNPTWVNTSTSPPSLQVWNGAAWIVVSGPALTASTASTLRSTSGAPTVLATDIIGDFAVDPTASLMYGPLTGSPRLGQAWINGGTSGAAVIALGSSSLALARPASLLLAPAGAVAETFPRLTTPVTGPLALSGTAKLNALPLLAGMIVSAANWIISSAAVAPTHQWSALCRADGVVVAVSADATSAAIATNATITNTFTAPYTVPTSGLYYMVWNSVCTTTQPGIWGMNGANNKLISITPILVGTAGGNALTGPPTLGASIGTIASSGVAYYGYLS